MSHQLCAPSAYGYLLQARLFLSEALSYSLSPFSPYSYLLWAVPCFSPYSYLL